MSEVGYKSDYLKELSTEYWRTLAYLQPLVKKVRELEERLDILWAAMQKEGEGLVESWEDDEDLAILLGLIIGKDGEC